MTVHHGTIPVSLPDDIPHTIAPLVPIALAMIERHFPATQRVEGVMGWDPEVGDIGSEWLELRLSLEGSVQEVLHADGAFSKEWLAAVPFPDHLLIHLSFKFL
jgi:hypothetical protein